MWMKDERRKVSTKIENLKATRSMNTRFYFKNSIMDYVFSAVRRRSPRRLMGIRQQRHWVIAWLHKWRDIWCPRENCRRATEKHSSSEYNTVDINRMRWNASLIIITTIAIKEMQSAKYWILEADIKPWWR